MRIDKYKYWSQRDIKMQAKHLIENCSEMEFCIHKINKFLIFDFYGKEYEVVNSEKMTLEVFSTEQEALDFCLDRLSGSKITKQMDLF